MAKASELKGRAVVSLETAQKIGTVEGLVFDPGVAQIVGLKVNAANTNGDDIRFVPAPAVYSVGPDAITVHDLGASWVSGPLPLTVDQLPDSAELGNTKVLTDSGTLLGSISDIQIDDSNMTILGYDLGGSVWDDLTGRRKFLPAQHGFRYGGDIMLVPDAMAGSLDQPAQNSASPGDWGGAVVTNQTQPDNNAAPTGDRIVIAPNSAATWANPVIDTPATGKPDRSADGEPTR